MFYETSGAFGKERFLEQRPRIIREREGNALSADRRDKRGADWVRSRVIVRLSRGDEEFPVFEGYFRRYFG